MALVARTGVQAEFMLAICRRQVSLTLPEQRPAATALLNRNGTLEPSEAFDPSGPSRRKADRPQGTRPLGREFAKDDLPSSPVPAVSHDGDGAP